MLLIMLLSLFLALFLAFGVYVLRFIQQSPVNNVPATTVDQERLDLIMGKNAYGIGTNDPQLVIVEFGDFACPYCQQSFSTIRQLSTDYFGKIRYIFRDYPVVSAHSLSLAMASRCAGDQGLYWPMHDKLFINQGVSSPEEISDLAVQAGVEPKEFTACMNNEDHLAAIRQDIIDADALGVDGTPTWFINGYKLSGYIPHEVFVETVEKILNAN